VSCWLVNTGWTGGAYGEGHRMPIQVTRTLLNAALEGHLDNVPMRTDRHFGFAVPQRVEGVDSKILDPRETWADKAAHDAMARKLVGMFVTNFTKFDAMVEADVRAASPTAQIAAE
jgi:phosphoenolpyruvate carboxykinase (ATP)